MVPEHLPARYFPAGQLMLEHLVHVVPPFRYWRAVHVGVGVQAGQLALYAGLGHCGTRPAGHGRLLPAQPPLHVSHKQLQFTAFAADPQLASTSASNAAACRASVGMVGFGRFFVAPLDPFANGDDTIDGAKKKGAGRVSGVR